MGKKGFPEVLARLEEQGPMYYNDILNFALKQRLVKSRASIPGLVNGLYKLGVVDRQEITKTRPMRTQYSINKRGKTILSYLHHIEAEISQQ